MRVRQLRRVQPLIPQRARIRAGSAVIRLRRQPLRRRTRNLNRQLLRAEPAVQVVPPAAVVGVLEAPLNAA